ncbi:MAG: cysteine desulfurase [Clostridia bacterium]|nr:cysteine desulfurase [Clostridia bacterium]
MIYLDNSATTKPCETAIAYLNRVLSSAWGNPSSRHRLGLESERFLREARQAVAARLHCREEEIIFTAGGTEGNNTAVFGAAMKGRKRGNRIVTTAIEHPSVAVAMDRLEQQGFEVIRLKPEKNGSISPEQFFSAVTPETVLVSVMLVNNETGAIQPVRAAADAIRQSGAPALLHCDAVQAFGKMPIAVEKLGVDLLTASGHKIHAVKGIGFLYLRKGVQIPAYLVGGGQESGRRSGTEPMPGIASLYGALKELPEEKNQLPRMQELWYYARDRFTALPGVEMNSPEGCLPYIFNMSVMGYRSETLLNALDQYGICVSSGSACAKGKGSTVLLESGLLPRRVDSALRLSFSRETTKEEIDRTADALGEIIKTMRKAYTK